MASRLMPESTGNVFVRPLELLADWRREARYLADQRADEVALFLRTRGGDECVRWSVAQDLGADGMVFFVLRADPADEIDPDGGAAALYKWGVLGREIRVAGTLELLGRVDAEEAFRGRPRDVQLLMHVGMWGSDLGADDSLAEALASITAHYTRREVPMPPGWQAFRFRPHRFEFWADQGEGMARVLLSG